MFLLPCLCSLVVLFLCLGVDVKKNVIVTVSSDKGLCGGINSTSVKISRALSKLNAGPDKETKYVILGEKAKAQLIRDSKQDILLSLTELQKNPLNYTQVSILCAIQWLMVLLNTFVPEHYGF